MRELRKETLLASNALWRALAVALHDANEAGVDQKTAIERLKAAGVSWKRTSNFFVGTLVDRDTGKLLSNRESIDAAADKLRSVMMKPAPGTERPDGGYRAPGGRPAVRVSRPGLSYGTPGVTRQIHPGRRARGGDGRR